MRTGPRFMLSVTVISALLSLSGCGQSRSPEAFCHVYIDHKRDYLTKYSAAANSINNDSDSFTALVGAVSMTAQSMGDLESMFDALDKVSPDSIEPDVAIIRDQLKQSIDSMSGAATDPLGTMLGSLMSGLAHQGSWQRVGTYVQENCHTT